MKKRFAVIPPTIFLIIAWGFVQHYRVSNCGTFILGMLGGCISGLIFVVLVTR